MLELFILVIAATALTVATRRRIAWRHGMIWMALELAGYVCFLAATVDNFWHFFGGYWSHTPDLLQMVLVVWLMSFVLGAMALLLLQMRAEKVKPGPYCPECGYCLIGSPRKICSECGRPFTLDELGITQGRSFHRMSIRPNLPFACFAPSRFYFSLVHRTLDSLKSGLPRRREAREEEMRFTSTWRYPVAWLA